MIAKGARPEAFSLIEVMIALVLTIVAMTALLGSLGTMLQFHRRCDEEWEQALERWNRAQELRAAPGPEDAPWMTPAEGCRPVRRFEVGSSTTWEVLIDE